MSSPQQFPEPSLEIARRNPLPVAAPTNHPATTHFLRDLLARIHSNGYSCIPIQPGRKSTSQRGWTKFCSEQPTKEQISAWLSGCPGHGIGIACGWSTVGIDIDEADPADALALEHLVKKRLGETPLKRTGRPPRSTLVYRVAPGAIVSSRHLRNVDIIGDRGYFVAYGIHPGTGRAYAWSTDTPLSTKVSNLPGVTQAQVDRLIEHLSGGHPAVDRERQAEHTGSLRLATISRSGSRWIRNERGQVIDGRDSLLAAKTYQAYANGASSSDEIADEAWIRFTAEADLTRTKRSSNQYWQKKDALAKATYLLRSRKPRPAAGIGSSSTGTTAAAWSRDDIERFVQNVNAAGAAGKLSPTQVAISHAMTEFARHKNDCFASCETIAKTVGCQPNTVKKARRRLRALGFWTSQQCRGGKGFIAHYQPSPAALACSPSLAVKHTRFSDGTMS
ncbi:hypothetical protein ABIE71_002246 [Bradyrhizobium diazoefficiens]